MLGPAVATDAADDVDDGGDGDDADDEDDAAGCGADGDDRGRDGFGPSALGKVDLLQARLAKLCYPQPVGMASPKSHSVGRSLPYCAGGTCRMRRITFFKVNSTVG